jgi:hypothetical protein
MPDESEFAPDLSKLDNRYQILSELRRARNGRIFLARHTELNRDVTIDVVRVPRCASSRPTPSCCRAAGTHTSFRLSRADGSATTRLPSCGRVFVVRR